MNVLTIFDLDETLFHTTAKVRVRKGVRIVRALTSHQYKTYKLKRGEEYDFSEYHNASLFVETSIPITPIWNKAKRILSHINDGSEMIIITARPDLDDKETFLECFRTYGFDIDSVHVHRAGNLTDYGDVTTSEAKSIIVAHYLDNFKFDKVRMYDDDPANLSNLLSLKKEYPKIQFETFLVKDETVSKYN